MSMATNFMNEVGALKTDKTNESAKKLEKQEYEDSVKYFKENINDFLSKFVDGYIDPNTVLFDINCKLIDNIPIYKDISLKEKIQSFFGYLGFAVLPIGNYHNYVIIKVNNFN